jgi:hypothetical protein
LINLKLKTYALLLLTFVLVQCEKPLIVNKPTPKQDFTYSFMVAGHAYGSPVNDQIGMYQPFVSEFSYLKDSSDISFSVLTGDVVNHSTTEEWNAVINEMNQLELDFHIAAGNHDRGALFIELFEEYYYSFLVEDDLFIILSPTNWNIKGEQKTFLEETISNFAPDAKNIFVFCHELIWWSPDSIFQNVGINYLPHYPGSTNYWADIDPIFKRVDNPIYLFAGDIGATSSSSPYMFYHYDNVRLIASGMGKGGNDNYLIVGITDDGEVKLNLMAIEGDRYRLGDIELYELP